MSHKRKKKQNNFKNTRQRKNKNPIFLEKARKIQNTMEEISHIESNIEIENEEIEKLNTQLHIILNSLVDGLISHSEKSFDIFEEYTRINEEINYRIKRNENREKEIVRKNNKLDYDKSQLVGISVEEFKKAQEIINQPKYKTMKDDPSMGLNNKRCSNPQAVCLLKEVNLSYSDIRKKRCLTKIKNKPCQHLCWNEDTLQNRILKEKDV
jgi:hypothetical protein